MEVMRIDQNLFPSVKLSSSAATATEGIGPYNHVGKSLKNTKLDHLMADSIRVYI